MPLLVVDNGSAFTPKISGLLESLGADFDLESFDGVGTGLMDGYDSFILSGRKNNDRVMNSANAGVVRHCVQRSKKLLGICYGAEILTLALGGTIRRMDGPQKGSRTVTPTKQNPLISDPIDAYESHRYELATLGADLESVASSASCRHEIVRHKKGGVFGTQFHPEMSGLSGRDLVANFLDMSVTTA